MITVLITLGVLFGSGILFGVGFMSGANYVLGKQKRAHNALVASEQERLKWITDNKKNPLEPPREPWGPNY